jgi:hypothetical protein
MDRVLAVKIGKAGKLLFIDHDQSQIGIGKNSLFGNSYSLLAARYY